MCLLARRQVMRVGAVHFLGGMMMRMPLWRLPLMEPPRASTMKLTRNLQRVKKKGTASGGRKDTGRKIEGSFITDTSEEDASHAVITGRPNKVGEREE